MLKNACRMYCLPDQDKSKPSRNRPAGMWQLAAAMQVQCKPGHAFLHGALPNRFMAVASRMCTQYNCRMLNGVSKAWKQYTIGITCATRGSTQAVCMG